MLKQGLVEEVRNWLAKYQNRPTAKQAIGYKEVVAYLDGVISYEEMVNKIKLETRHYAKRQLTWFKKNQDYQWLNGEDGNQKNIEIILEEWRK